MKPDRETNTIFQLAFQGKLEELKDLVINNGGDVNAIDPITKVKPIHFATLGCQPEVIKFLLSQKADINERVEANDYTPLHIASRESGDLFIASELTTTRRGGADLIMPTQGGYIDVATLLLEKGADIEAQDKNGMTPLLIAAKYGNVPMIKFLVEKGVKIDALANNMTPLHFAIENNHDLAAEELIRLGAKIELTKLGEIPTPKFNAENRDTTIAISQLTKEKTVEADYGLGKTPLHLAAQNGDTSMVNFIVQKRRKINIDELDYANASALHYAIKNGHYETTEKLIELGANIDLADINGKTPLHLAAQNGNVKIFKLLVEKGADIMAKAKNDMMIFHFAAQNGNTEILKIKEMNASPPSASKPREKNGEKLTEASKDKGGKKIIVDNR